LYQSGVIVLDLQYMFPYMRAMLIVCALFSTILSVFLIIQLALFRRIAEQDKARLGRVATAHETVGWLLVCISIIASGILWLAVALIDKNIEFESGYRLSPPQSPVPQSAARN
jgi:hypothetical protein